MRKLGDARVREQVRTAIEEVEAAATLADVRGARKLSGSSGFYRLRVGDYRIGMSVAGDTVEFVRVLHRREIYRHFP